MRIAFRSRPGHTPRIGRDRNATLREYMPPKSDDYAIIQRILRGDADAYAQLVDRYGEEIFRIVSGHVPFADVASVAHDAFVRAYGSLSGYKPEKPLVRWLTTIAVRTCHDYWRKRYRSRETLESDLPRTWTKTMETSVADTAPDPEEEVALGEDVELLHRALENLPPLDRMVVTLMHLEELSVKETAGMLDMSIANVKVRAFRARRKLREALTELEPQGGG